MEYRFFPYYYDEDAGKFMPTRLRYSRSYLSIQEELSKGMRSREEYENAYRLHGPCQIEVPYKGVLGIFIDEVVSPFYIFQVGQQLSYSLGRQRRTLDV